MRRRSTSFGRRNLRTARRKGEFNFARFAGFVADYNPTTSRTILNGSNVQTVEDSATSEGKQNATQSTAADQPAYTSSNANLNGKPSVDHTASSGHWLDIGNEHNPGTNALHVFWVWYGTETTANQTLFRKRVAGSLGTASGWMLRYSGESGGTSDFFGNVEDTGGNNRSGTLSVTGASLVDGNAHIIEMHWDPSGPDLRVWVDGSKSSKASGSPSVTNVSTADNLAIGALWNSASTQSQFLDNSWGRALLYIPNSPMPDDDKTTIREAIADEYGVTLP